MKKLQRSFRKKASRNTDQLQEIHFTFNLVIIAEPTKTIHMKLFLLFILCSCFASGMQGQSKFFRKECKALDKASFFKSIKFGGHIPASFSALCASDNTEKACKAKYPDLFKFQNTAFTKASIYANAKGEINTVNMWKILPPPTDSVNYSHPIYPNEYNELYKKMVARFGTPAQEDEYDMVMGATRKLRWSCLDIDMDLSINYGATNKDINFLTLRIYHRGYDIPEQQTLP